MQFGQQQSDYRRRFVGFGAVLLFHLPNRSNVVNEGTLQPPGALPSVRNTPQFRSAPFG